MWSKTASGVIKGGLHIYYGFISSILKDDLEKLFEKIDSAVAIAITAPCYILTASSQIKALIDSTAARALDRIENDAPRRPGVLQYNELSFERIRNNSSLFAFPARILYHK